MCGITVPAWRNYVIATGQRERFNEPMRSLGRADVEAFYGWWWDRPELGLARLERPGSQFVVFDASVLSGRGRITRMVQGVVGVNQDGIIGPRTAAAVNAMGGAFVARMADATEAWYRGIVAHDPSQGVFLNGWLNRNDERLAFAVELDKENAE